jgi:hypothetical protein
LALSRTFDTPAGQVRFEVDDGYHQNVFVRYRGRGAALKALGVVTPKMLEVGTTGKCRFDSTGNNFKRTHFKKTGVYEFRFERDLDADIDLTELNRG